MTDTELLRMLVIRLRLRIGPVTVSEWLDDGYHDSVGYLVRTRWGRDEIMIEYEDYLRLCVLADDEAHIRPDDNQ